jgi:hypothetical protein
MNRKWKFPRFVTRRKIISWARESWDAAEGDEVTALKAFEDRARSYRVDPATIAMLVIAAVRFWLWLKENGFLKKAPTTGGEEFFRDIEGAPEDE